MKKRYDSYKPSGIDWIGDIPSHWEIQRLKFGMNLINGRAYLQPELLSEGKYRILRVGNFFTNDSWYYSDMELEDNKYCSKGDLYMHGLLLLVHTYGMKKKLSFTTIYGRLVYQVKWIKNIPSICLMSSRK